MYARTNQAKCARQAPQHNNTRTARHDTHMEIAGKEMCHEGRQAAPSGAVAPAAPDPDRSAVPSYHPCKCNAVHVPPQYMLSEFLLCAEQVEHTQPIQYSNYM